jgi:hypothetical protein
MKWPDFSAGQKDGTVHEALLFRRAFYFAFFSCKLCLKIVLVFATPSLGAEGAGLLREKRAK